MLSVRDLPSCEATLLLPPPCGEEGEDVTECGTDGGSLSWKFSPSLAPLSIPVAIEDDDVRVKDPDGEGRRTEKENGAVQLD